MPRISAAALSRVIQRRRNSRFLARRSRKANMPARSRVSLADFRSRRRPPTKPFARLKIRFFRWLRAAPLFERIGVSRSAKWWLDGERMRDGADPGPTGPGPTRGDRIDRAA